MGLNIFARSSDKRISDNTYLPNDPRPDTFEIESLEQIGDHVLGLVKYPHATNYEGRKVLVWCYTKVSEIESMVLIDPHFLPENKIIARFRPTRVGLYLAREFCKSLNSLEDSMQSFIPL